MPPNCESIVPTALLEEVLTPLMKKLDRALANTGLIADADRNEKDDEANGAVQILSERVAAQTGWSTEAVSRRLYEIRNWDVRHRKATNVDTADALLIALGTDLREESVPVFPGSAHAARDCVDVWAEDWPEADRERLARQLHRFCQGFVTAVTMDEPEAICALAAKNSFLARRLLEHDGTVASAEEVARFQGFCRGYYHASLPAIGVKESLKRSNDPAYIRALLCFHLDEPEYPLEQPAPPLTDVLYEALPPEEAIPA